MNEIGVKQACNTLFKHDIDALIVIGGVGSFHGLQAIKRYWQGQVIGLPGTIDNDLFGCDKTIGFATAVHTATRAIDKIRDTANAFDRVFIVEVMGRHSGHIAFQVGLSCGAESIFSFENYDSVHHEIHLRELIEQIRRQQKSVMPATSLFLQKICGLVVRAHSRQNLNLKVKSKVRYVYSGTFKEEEIRFLKIVY